MPCFVPFNNSLDLTFFVLRSVSVRDDEIIHAMKWFSFHAEDHGCVYSSVMKSIHGNLVVWYGAWIKRSKENRHKLNAILLSAIESLSHLAVLIQHGFYAVYAGESKDRQANARFSSGDTILLCGMSPASEDSSNLSYTCMAILRSDFESIKGLTAGVCLECPDRPLVAILYVWKSLEACYSWLITADYRRTIRPYISSFSNEAQYDIFKVLYVSSDDGLDFQASHSAAAVRSEDGKGKLQLE